LKQHKKNRDTGGKQSGGIPTKNGEGHMSNSDTGMILRENISAGAFTPAPDGVPADSRTARLEQHPKGNERTSPEKTLEIQKLYFNNMN
jgi:hypothetical protein